jgi:hypothetical protein
MDQPNRETFGQWLSDRLDKARLSPREIASLLGYADPAFLKAICENKSRLPIKDWPNLSKALQMRMDEFLIVMEHFHPDWLMEYDGFISNCLRYLLWRMESDSAQDRSWLETLLGRALEEIIEPACTGRFFAKVERRMHDRRKTSYPEVKDRRVKLRRLSDLVQYFKNQLEMNPVFILLIPGISILQAWCLS